MERIALAAREAKVRNMTPTVMIDMAAEMKRCEDADSCHTFLTLCLAPSHLTRRSWWLYPRRIRHGVRMVKVKTRQGKTTSVAVYEAGEECDVDCTVVLDAGLGMSAISWSWVMREVAKSCRVVAFDRPGLGASPSLPSGSGWLRRVDDIVELNRAVLAEMGVRGRLILVGHSTSGMHVRLHAHLHKEEVMAAVLVDAAHEGQLNAAEGNSVYNSYPPAHVTEAKLSRVKRLWHSGLLRLMYIASGPTFWRACTMFPPLFLALRWLDWMGRAAAQGVLQNQRMLAPHFPPEERARFMDEQFSLEGMSGMIAEHGSQRDSMSYMLEQGIMRPLSLGRLPLLVISRDPQKGAGGGLYPNARGDPAREAQHEVRSRPC